MEFVQLDSNSVFFLWFVSLLGWFNVRNFSWFEFESTCLRSKVNAGPLLLYASLA